MWYVVFCFTVTAAHELPNCLSIYLSMYLFYLSNYHASSVHRKDIVFSPFAHHLHRKFDQISWHYAAKLNISFIGSDANPFIPSDVLCICPLARSDSTRLDSFVVIRWLFFDCELICMSLYMIDMSPLYMRGDAHVGHYINEKGRWLIQVACLL